MNLVTGLWGMNVHVPGEGVDGLGWFFGVRPSPSSPLPRPRHASPFILRHLQLLMSLVRADRRLPHRVRHLRRLHDLEGLRAAQLGPLSSSIPLPPCLDCRSSSRLSFAVRLAAVSCSITPSLRPAPHAFLAFSPRALPPRSSCAAWRCAPSKPAHREGSSQREGHERRALLSEPRRTRGSSKEEVATRSRGTCTSRAANGLLSRGLDAALKRLWCRELADEARQQLAGDERRSSSSSTAQPALSMLADLDLALKRPAELVQQLYAQDASLDGFDQRVASSFSALISADGALEQVRGRSRPYPG